MRKRLIVAIIGVAFTCGACGGGSSSSGGPTGPPAALVSSSDLTGTCAFTLMATTTPGALIPDASSTVLAGVWTFDGKGGVSGEAAANGPGNNGEFASLTGSYTMTQYGTGSIMVTQAGQSYNLDFAINDSFDELSVTGVSGSRTVVGGCNL